MVGFTFGCAPTRPPATPAPDPIQAINWAIPENNLAALRDAAADGVITDDEVIAYGRTLIFDAPDPHQRPMDAADGTLYTHRLRPYYHTGLDRLCSEAERAHKDYIHLQLDRNGKRPREELYLSTARLRMLADYCHKTEQALGLPATNYVIHNRRGSSQYDAASNSVYLDGREEASHSAEFFFFTVAHEDGHRFQWHYDPWQKTAHRRASKLRDKPYAFKYHLEENKADSLAAELSPGHVKGAFELFIGNIAGEDYDAVQARLARAAQPDLPDTHAPGLERVKRMMRIAGRKLQ